MEKWMNYITKQLDRNGTYLQMNYLPVNLVVELPLLEFSLLSVAIFVTLLSLNLYATASTFDLVASC